MSDDFVPFLPAGLSPQPPGAFQPRVLPQAANAQPAVTNTPAAAVAKLASNPNEPRGCEPQVAVHREGERITSIRIQCACGQVIELACVY